MNDVSRAHQIINSAIASPAHGETLALSNADITTEGSKVYIVKGYAYAGGGRRITRVELSWDDGRRWQMADMQVLQVCRHLCFTASILNGLHRDYPEDQFRRMKFEHPIYGLLDLTECDTCLSVCFAFLVSLDDDSDYYISIQLLVLLESPPPIERLSTIRLLDGARHG